MSDNIEPPTLFEVSEICKDAGLVNETSTVLTVVLGIVRGGLILMTGPSRSGKDEIVDAAEQAFVSNQLVYRWPSDDSKTAAYYNRNEINSYPVHRFSDLASLPEHLEVVLKAFGEGRDAERVFTDISKQEGDEAQQQVLEAPRTTIAFAATDNESINLDEYPELRNRALILTPDASEDQTAQIMDRQSREHAGLVEEEVEPIRKAQIRNYLTNIPVEYWTESSDRRFINPSAIAVDEQEPIPASFVEARQDFDRLLNFIQTVALYHHEERMKPEIDGKESMLVTPVDVWLAMKILGEKMVMSSLNLQQDDVAILQLLRNESASLSKAQLQQDLRSLGYNINDRVVRSSLQSMREKGYVREHQGTPNTYTVSEFGQLIEHDAGLDYTTLVERTKEVAFEALPEDVADEYVTRFCEGEGLHAVHPFDGYEVDITEDTFDEEISEREDELSEILKDEPFGGDEPDGDNTSQELQGTL